MINGILHEGEWITDPIAIKSAFLNFFKVKFSRHDTSLTFPPTMASKSLSDSDVIFLDSMVFLEEIKSVVWDCGSQKAPGPMVPPASNSSFFTLIPKVSNPLFIKDYRPISLIGVHYKIIAKIVANRLSKVIDSIISHEQSAFISDRQILDGPLILSEVIDWYKKRKKKMMLFKVNFEKAFDSVSWRFLDYIMEKLGFSSQRCRWIKAGLSSSRASILVNGSPTSEFSLKRGLRKGDPLSHFLFIIVMEGLNIMLKDGLPANLFRGIKIGSHSLHLSHLFYADDVIIFFEWHQSDMDNIIQGTGCSSSSLPFSYLGLPIGSNMGRISYWIVLIDRFKARLSRWKANRLSSGGRLTLIKAVLGILGGLGVGSLKAFNASLLLKWRCRLLKNPSTLWVNVVKSIHDDEAGIDIKGCQTNGLWARIVDTWLGDVPLYSRFNRLFRLEREKNCILRDRFANEDWSWGWYRPINGGGTLADINSLFMDLNSITLSNDVDVVSSLYPQT
nr:hypothetical protein [Tanacetum cinerariifolium]